MGSKDRVILFLISGSMIGDFVWGGLGWGWYLVTRSSLYCTAHQISLIGTFYILLAIKSVKAEGYKPIISFMAQSP